MNFLGEQQWLLFGLIFFGVIAYVAWIRWRDRLWIERHYGMSSTKMVSFGVNYFGLASEPSRRNPSSGFLLLLADRIVYRSRFRRVTLEITGSQITQISHGTNHGGVNLHQPVIKIIYRTPDNKQDAAAFKVPYPVQWKAALEANFLKNKTNISEDITSVN